MHFVGQSQACLCGWAAIESRGLQVNDEPDAADRATSGLLLLRAGAFEVRPAERNKQPQKIKWTPYEASAKKNKMHIHNCLIVRLYTQLRKSALS